MTPAPSSDRELDAYREQADRFISELDEEFYLHYAGLKETFDLALIASLQIGSRHARKYFREYRTRHGRLPQSLCMWIGPEGDFTPEEIAAAETAGALPITLGRRVLRAETAAISSLAILNYELESASSA